MKIMSLARIAVVSLVAVFGSAAAQAVEVRSVDEGMAVELSQSNYAPGETIVIKALNARSRLSSMLTYAWVGPAERGASYYYSTWSSDGVEIVLPVDAPEGRYFVGLLQYNTGIDSTLYFDVENFGVQLDEDDRVLTPIYFDVRARR